ncbi:MAG: hypothetical protein HYT48_00165 [Candidatus Vogelbacteria bacterium]|nr:hypothetical protein [Candidatus Vogelbacteria bacterium]
MMMKKINFKKIFGKLAAGHDRDPLKFAPDPFADWQRMFAIALMGIILLFILHSLLYLKLSRVGEIKPVAGTALGIDRKALDQVSQYINERAARFRSLQSQ